MHNKIQIGEMAKLHNISAQTLRYYDKIGLLKPEYMDKDNNYRYYNIEQFAHLDSILFLKELGMSLEQIKEYFKKRDIESVLELLKQRDSDIEKQIKLLKRRQRNLQDKVSMIELYMQKKEYNNYQLKDIPSRNMVHLKSKLSKSKTDFEYGLKTLSKLIGDEIYFFNSMITCVIDKKSIEKGIYDYWSSIGLLFSEHLLENENIETIPAGKYASIVYGGNYDKGKEYYEKLLNWIKEHNLQVVGDSLLITITDSVFSDFEEEYINEIQIPVKKY
ncbi:MerR family transcriptional regulator [Gottschalkia acidurici]|nr:MerR family transcriptional regulator [Gottschalkia acidurici]